MLEDIVCPYCNKEFTQHLELEIDDGSAICSDVTNCPFCQHQISFSIEVSITAVKFED